MHALVVGGTGMLREVVYYLASQGHIVSVIARHQSSIEDLLNQESKHGENIHGWALDYHGNEELESMLNHAIAQYGPITLTVAWIHSTAREAPFNIAKHAQGDFFHVRSASVGKANYQDPFNIPAIQDLAGLHYHRIILGSAVEGNLSRWLSNDEISKGVISSLQNREDESIVGTIAL